MFTRMTLATAAASAMAAFAATPAWAAEDATPRVIVVTGEGEATAAPDMATLMIGVQTEAPTAAAALAANAERMDTTIKKLRARGIAEKDIQTSGLSLSPQYNYERSDRTPPRIVGYTASNMVTIKVRQLAKAGSIIDDAVSNGANSMSGLTFGFADPAPLMRDARKDAVADARERAELYADAAGVRLGRVLRISDGFTAIPTPGPVMDYAVAEAKAASTPVSVGESSVNAQVTIVYEIE